MYLQGRLFVITFTFYGINLRKEEEDLQNPALENSLKEEPKSGEDETEPIR